MSAAEALKAARAAGIQLGVDGDDLVLEASVPPPAAVLDLLSRHKAEIVALLRPAEDGWSAEDWQVFFDERAGIVEFDGGLPRAEAEARAFEACVLEWLNRNPDPSSLAKIEAALGRNGVSVFRHPSPGFQHIGQLSARAYFNTNMRARVMGSY